jgi:hypothetical protein
VVREETGVMVGLPGFLLAIHDASLGRKILVEKLQLLF